MKLVVDNAQSGGACINIEKHTKTGRKKLVEIRILDGGNANIKVSGDSLYGKGADIVLSALEKRDGIIIVEKI